MAVAEYDTGGKISVLASDTGVAKRVLSGAQTNLGHVSSLTIDRAHGELLSEPPRALTCPNARCSSPA
ncbi:MAG TPA: hypothetical protein VNO55_08560 [Polyangia bacterium]|nr:hypothetical protein [Polyangia bacterium]